MNECVRRGFSCGDCEISGCQTLAADESEARMIGVMVKAVLDNRLRSEEVEVIDHLVGEWRDRAIKAEETLSRVHEAAHIAGLEPRDSGHRTAVYADALLRVRTALEPLPEWTACKGRPCEFCGSDQ